LAIWPFAASSTVGIFSFILWKCLYSIYKHTHKHTHRPNQRWNMHIRSFSRISKENHRLHRWQLCVFNCAPEDYKVNLAAYFKRKGTKGGNGTKGIKKRIEETEEKDRWKWLPFEFQCTFSSSKLQFL
jgi:hypothetical protein